MLCPADNQHARLAARCTTGVHSVAGMVREAGMEDVVWAFGDVGTTAETKTD